MTSDFETLEETFSESTVLWIEPSWSLFLHLLKSIFVIFLYIYIYKDILIVLKGLYHCWIFFRGLKQMEVLA